MKNKKSIYEAYPLYRLLFGGSQVAKEYEAHVEALLAYELEIPTVDYLEIGSGLGEHAEPISRYAQALGVNLRYNGIDKFVPAADSRFIQADVMAWTPEPDHLKYDLMSLPYNGLEGMFWTNKELDEFLEHAPKLARVLALPLSNAGRPLPGYYRFRIGPLHPVLSRDFFELLEVDPASGYTVTAEYSIFQSRALTTYTDFVIKLHGTNTTTFEFREYALGIAYRTPAEMSKAFKRHKLTADLFLVPDIGADPFYDHSPIAPGTLDKWNRALVVL